MTGSPKRQMQELSRTNTKGQALDSLQEILSSFQSSGAGNASFAAAQTLAQNLDRCLR